MLHGQVINVKPIVDLIFSRGAYGQANTANNQIYIQISTDSCPIPKTIVEETFIHELIHQILHHMPQKYQDLNEDEDFVEGFGQLLHQALTSQEGNTLENERTTKSNIQRGGSKAK